MSSTGPILIYGAAGAQGGAVVRAALAAGKQVRILLRAGTANPHGDAVEVARGDLGDVASLRRASEGAAGVYLTIPLVYDRERVVSWGRNAIDAAVAAGARLLVFNTSSVVPDKPIGITGIDIKVDLEAHLQRARLPSITLRTTAYMDNLTAPWSAPAIVHQGVVAYPLPADYRVAWMSHGEAAAYAVAALGRPDLAAGKPVFQTGGPRALTGPDVAGILGGVLDRSVSYAPIPLEHFEAGLNATLGAGIGTEVVRVYRWLHEPSRRRILDVDPKPARAALGVAPRTFEQWAGSIHWTQLAGAAELAGAAR